MKLFTILIILIVSGCTSMGITEQKTIKIEDSVKEKDSLEIASFPSQLRGAYIYTDNAGKKVVCAEPFADVAASSSLSATANAVNNLSTTLNRSLNNTSNRTGEFSRNRNNERSWAEGDNSSSTSLNNSLSRNNQISRSTGTTYGTTGQAEQQLSLGLNAVNQIVALEGRTQFVLLAREMLFRTCEAAANGHITTTGKVAEQHGLIFSALTKMIEAQKAEAELKKAKAESEKVKAIASVTKLNPEILRIFNDNSLNQTMKEQYLEQYTKCTGAANGDSEKIKKCKDDYHSKLNRLIGG